MPKISKEEANANLMEIKVKIAGDVLNAEDIDHLMRIIEEVRKQHAEDVVPEHVPAAASSAQYASMLFNGYD